ncbi:MAG TPA: glycosyltransferase family 39 protein [Bacteroidota bacterium]|jgi:hypothetical protein
MKFFFHRRGPEGPTSGKNQPGFAGEDSRGRKAAEWFLLALILLLVGLLRFRLLGIPLERDEGEFAYMGQQILKGIPLYTQAYDIKFPGVYLMYALIMSLFGQTTVGIHLGLLLVNSISTVLLFLLGKKIAGGFTGIISAAGFAILSLSVSTNGFATHATQFVVLPALGGVFLLLRALEDGGRVRYYVWSGVASGVALVMKQAAIFFILFSVTYAVLHSLGSGARRPGKETVLKLTGLVLGSLLPLSAAILWLYAIGAFEKFWYWAVVYASTFGSQASMSEGLGLFWGNFSRVVDGFFLLWILGLLGMLTLPFQTGLNVKKSFPVLFALFSFLAVCPGFLFRPHYFVMVLPAVALLAGSFANLVRLRTPGGPGGRLSLIAASGLVAVAIATGLFSQRGYFFRDDMKKILRDTYGANPFPEAVQVAEFIASRSAPTDKIAVLGSEPEICFYSGRQSATSYIDTYNLMVPHPDALWMQTDMIREIESQEVKFIVFVTTYASWAQRPGSETHILDWLRSYLTDHYSTVGVAEIVSADSTRYDWNVKGSDYRVKAASALLVFERR